MSETPFTDRELFELVRHHLDVRKIERQDNVPAEAMRALLDRLALRLEEDEDKPKKKKKLKKRKSASQPDSLKPSTLSAGDPISLMVLRSDGGSRGNPGPATYGFILLDKDGRLIEEGNGRLGVATNNVAEYKALLAALEIAAHYHPECLHVQLDSQLVVRQLTGVYKVKHPDMIPLHAGVNQLIRRFKKVVIEHIPRNNNTHADYLAQQAHDSCDRGHHV